MMVGPLQSGKMLGTTWEAMGSRRFVAWGGMSLKRRIVILGGGIIGLSAARRLALDGHRVLLLDRHGLGQHASGRAGGILVRRGVLRSDDPGRMFYTRSIDAWPEWIAALIRESGLEVPLWEGGDLCLFAHRGRAARFAARLEQESNGGDWEELAALPQYLKAVVADRSWRIFHFPREICLDPHQALDALIASCKRAGVELWSDCPPFQVERDGQGWRVLIENASIPADVLVVAAGPWSTGVLGALGWHADSAAVRGQIALVPALYPGLSMLHLEDGCYAVPRHGSTLIGATSEVGQWDEATTDEGLADLERRMRVLFPGLDLSLATQTWAGIRPRTKDRVPHLGWLEPDRLLVASGHYRSGISMAPLSGEVIADLVAGRQVDAHVKELEPLRTPGGFRAA